MKGALVELALWLGAAAFFVLGFGLPERTTPRFVAGPRSDGVLRVVTWNVGGAAEASGEGWGDALDDRDIGHVAGVLGGLDADLCLLQEMRVGFQARDLARALGDEWERVSGPSTGGRRVAAFARGPLRELEWDELPRGALAIAYERDGEEFTAIVLHASAPSSAARNDVIGRAAGSLEKRAGDVLAGDLNLDLDLDKRRDLFTDDAYLDVETYNFVATRFRDAGRGTGSTAEPDRRLDYVFVDDERFEVVAAGPVKGRRVRAMDHDPVVADLRRRD